MGNGNSRSPSGMKTRNQQRLIFCDEMTKSLRLRSDFLKTDLVLSHGVRKATATVLFVRVDWHRIVGAAYGEESDHYWGRACRIDGGA